MSIIHDPRLLKGTCYLEFLPGDYAGTFWNRGSVFFTVNDFSLVLPTFTVLPEFDYYAFIPISTCQWQQVLAQMAELQNIIKQRDAHAIEAYYKLHCPHMAGVSVRRLAGRVAVTSSLLQEFVPWVQVTLQHHDVITYLGM